MTDKQQRFVDEYMVDLNATQAAIRAGYSPKKRRAGRLSATSENLYAEPEGGEGHHYQDLFTYMVSRTPITAIFSIEGDSPNLGDDKFDEVPKGGWTYSKTAKALTGKVIITSLELNAQNGENASFTATFTGTGPLVSKTMAG